MIWTGLFLLFVGVLLPLAAWGSRRQLASVDSSTEDLASAGAIAAQSLVIHAVMTALALASLAANSLRIAWVADVGLTPLLAALGVLVAALGLAWLEARRPLDAGDALRARLRRTGITPLGVVVMVAAAFAEEIAYRGALVAVVAPIASPLGAALISAALFGLAHLAQGWRGGLASAAAGLAMQALYAFSGALLVPVLTHLLYDMGAAELGRRLARSDDRNADGHGVV